MKLRPKATAKQQEDLPSALAQAIDHLRNERLDQAEPALLAILKRWPDQPDAMHFLGVLRHTQGRVDDAVALIRAALTLVPSLPSAWNNLGNVLQLARRSDEAAEAYDHALQHAPHAADRAMALNNLGLLHRRLKRLDSSEMAFRRALEQLPDYGVDGAIVRVSQYFSEYCRFSGLKSTCSTW